MTELIQAPYPSDTRAKGWRFELAMEDVKASDTWLRAKTGAVKGALLLLWSEAWQQTPCGSLPNDDELLALLIDMEPEEFAKKKSVLMRGWSLATDGRLYHATITARVLAMLEKREKDAKRTANRRAKLALPEETHNGVDDLSRVTTEGHTQDPPVSSTPSTKHQAPVEGQSNLTVAPGHRPDDRPADAGPAKPKPPGQQSLVETDPPAELREGHSPAAGAEKIASEGQGLGAAKKPPQRPGLPECPHLEILALWAEVLPAMPQHEPDLWRGARADHLRARWRETAVRKGWRSREDGLAYFRRLFAHIGESDFLSGRVRPRDGSRPFVAKLDWVLMPNNWAKVLEGNYNEVAA